MRAHLTAVLLAILALYAATTHAYAASYTTLIHVSYSLVEGKDGYMLFIQPSVGRVVNYTIAGGPLLQAILLEYPVSEHARVHVEVEASDPAILEGVGLARGAPLYLWLGDRLVLTAPIFYPNGVKLPGVLYNYAVADGVLRVWLYPVQVEGDRVTIYRKLLVHVHIEPVASAGDEGSAVLVIAEDLDTARMVAKMLEEVHPGVKVFAAGLSNVTSVEPLMPQQPLPGVLNPVVPPPKWLSGYDVVLAMKIRGFIAEMHREKGVKYVVIVGGASEVPPSYYYSSLTLYQYLGSYDAWIPTDYLYADLDLDMQPDVYVGRIPFSDSKLLQLYFQKVKEYEENMKTPSITVVGGYPFTQNPPSAEAFFTTMTVKLHVFDGLHAVFMTRTIGNYTADAVKSLLTTDPETTWIFLLTHGSGSAFLDIAYNETHGVFTFETLVTARQVMEESKPRPVGIVSSVACRNGAWDFDLAQSYYFKPPSIGWALVASWGAVAYIGQARVAVEWFQVPWYQFDHGIAEANMGGTSMLHAYIIRAWSVKGAETLGEAFWRGIGDYLATEYAHAFLEPPMGTPLGFVMALEAELLGDPLLPLPEPKPATPPAFTPTGYYRLLDASIFTYGYNGTVPLYRPGYAEKLVVESVGLHSVALAVATGTPPYLNSYVHVETVEPGVVELGGRLTGLIMAAGVSHHGYLLAFTPAVGVYAKLMNTTLVVKVWGGDLIAPSSYTPLMVYIDGRLAGIMLEHSGSFNTSYEEPGVHRIIVLPYQPPYATGAYRLLRMFFADNVTLYARESLELDVGNPIDLEDGVVIPVAVFLRGRPVDAKLQVQAPVEPLVERVRPGYYLVVLRGLKPGSYIVNITAVYESRFVEASGYASVGLEAGKVGVIVERLAGIMKGELSELKSSVEGGFSLLAKRLEESTAALREDIAETRKEIITAVSEASEATVTRLSSIARRLAESLAVNITRGVERSAEQLRVEVGKLEGRVETLNATLSSMIEALGSSIESKLAQVNANLEDVDSKASQALAKTSEAASYAMAAAGASIAAAVLVGVSLAVKRRAA